MVEIYTFALVTKGNSGTGYLLDRSPYNSEGHSTLAFCRASHRSWDYQLAARSLGNRFSVYSSSSQFLVLVDWARYYSKGERVVK